MAAGQLAALLPRAVAESRSARVLPEGLCFEHQAAPCHGTCPANIDIPSFIAHIGHGDYRAAIEVMRRDNPLPLTCGLVCPAPCESACVRGGSNGAVFIRPMKAKAAERLPRKRRLPETRDRAGQRQTGRDRRLRSSRSHRRLLPAHVRPRGRDPRGAGAGRRHAALRDSGLSHATRAARPRARRDPGARNRDPHRRRGRQYRGLPQATTTRCSSASAPSARV